MIENGIDPNNNWGIQRFSHLEIPTTKYQYLVGITIWYPRVSSLISLSMFNHWYQSFTCMLGQHRSQLLKTQNRSHNFKWIDFPKNKNKKKLRKSSLLMKCSKLTRYFNNYTNSATCREHTMLLSSPHSDIHDIRQSILSSSSSKRSLDLCTLMMLVIFFFWSNHLQILLWSLQTSVFGFWLLCRAWSKSPRSTKGGHSITRTSGGSMAKRGCGTTRTAWGGKPAAQTHLWTSSWPRMPISSWVRWAPHGARWLTVCGAPVGRRWPATSASTRIGTGRVSRVSPFRRPPGEATLCKISRTTWKNLIIQG